MSFITGCISESIISSTATMSAEKNCPSVYKKWKTAAQPTLTVAKFNINTLIIDLTKYRETLHCLSVIANICTQ